MFILLSWDMNHQPLRTNESCHGDETDRRVEGSSEHAACRSLHISKRPGDTFTAAHQQKKRTRMMGKEWISQNWFGASAIYLAVMTTSTQIWARSKPETSCLWPFFWRTPNTCFLTIFSCQKKSNIGPKLEPQRKITWKWILNTQSFQQGKQFHMFYNYAAK